MKKYNPISKIELEKLPKNIVEEVKSTLKVYDRCFVFYQNGKFETSAVIGLYSTYPEDYKFIGIAYMEDIYTKEEQFENYKKIDY